MIHVLFAPDYRAGVLYQDHLAQALKSEGVEVTFLSQQYRGLPLTRGLASTEKIDLLHLHWEEPYQCSTLEKWGYPFDMAWTAKRIPLVSTAHNLYPHESNRSNWDWFLRQQTLKHSQRLFCHGKQAAALLQQEFQVPPHKQVLIPLGDNSVGFPALLPLKEARAQLGIPCKEKLALMIGAIRPYKAILDVMEWWIHENPSGARLAIVGEASEIPLKQEIQRLAASVSPTPFLLDLERQTQDRMRLWLSASHAVLCNYRQTLSSATANLARCLGIPLLLPSRCSSLDLGEPCPAVFRFFSLYGDLKEQLDTAFQQGRNEASALAWRKKTRWDTVAQITASTYRQILSLP